MSQSATIIEAVPTGGGGAECAGFAERRAAARRQAAERLRRRISVAVGAEMRALDPLRSDPGRGGARRAALIVAAGVSVHVAIAAALVAVGGFGAPHPVASKPERVVVRMVEPVPAVPLPEPEAAKRIEPEPKPKRIARAVAPAPIPPDPIETPRPPVEPPTTPRRVVGLSLESTVTAGSGPAFAIGNTRTGETGDKAAEPADVRPMGGSPAAAKGSNAAADFVPTGDAAVVKPRRLAEPRLDYPAALKAQGIEGDVAVLIRIGADGAVGDVRIVKSSGVQELDAAARAAAQRERFSPATRDGEAIEYTLKYTYRFRIVEG
jgi:periplasmic protein TonB